MAEIHFRKNGTTNHLDYRSIDVVHIKNNDIECIPKIDASTKGIRIPTSQPSTVYNGYIWVG